MTCTPVYVPPGHLEYLFPPDECWTGAYAAVKKKVMTWRNNELRIILDERDKACFVGSCDGHILTSTHEGIIRRGDVMGWQPKARRLVIFNGFSIRLCDLCHDTPREPAREEVAAFMCDQYGRDVVCEWLLSLEFKTPHPMQVWAERQRKNDAIRQTREWQGRGYCTQGARP